MGKPSDKIEQNSLADTSNHRVQGKTLSSSELLPMLAGRGPVRFDACVFTDPINLSNLRFSDAVEFRGCQFHQHVDASGSVFDMGLTMDGCVFHKSITLRSLRSRGDVLLSGSIVFPPEGFERFKNIDLPPYHPPPPFRSAKWDSMVIQGNLIANQLTVYGSLDIGHIEIHGAIWMRGVRVGLNVPWVNTKFGGRLYARQIYVDGDFELEPYTSETLDGDSTPSFIGGSLSIGASIIKGRLNIRGIDILGCLHAITVHVKGRILADCWQHPNRETHPRDIHRTVIGCVDKDNQRSVFFHDSTIDEAVWFSGLLAKGSIEFENSRIGGALELDPWPKESRSTEISYGTCVGKNAFGESVVFKNARISANVQVDGIRTTGRIAGHNADIGAAFLCRPRRYKTHHGAYKTFRPRIGTNPHLKSLSLYGAKIGSNVELTGAYLEGGVRMRYAKIEGAFIAQSWHDEDNFGPSYSGGLFTIDPKPLPRFGFTDKGQSIYLYGARIGGNLCLESAVLLGYLSIELATIHGSLVLNSSHFCSAQMGYDQKMQPISEPVRDRYIEVTRQHLNKEEQTFGIRLAKAKIENDARLWNVSVGNNISGNGCQILGGLSFTESDQDKAEARGEVNFDSSKISGAANFANLKTPKLSLRNSSLGSIKLSLAPTSTENSVCMEIQNIDVSGFEFNDLAAEPHSPNIQSTLESSKREGGGKMRHLLLRDVSLTLAVLVLGFTCHTKLPHSEGRIALWALIACLLIKTILLKLRALYRHVNHLRVSKERNKYVSLLSSTPLDVSTYMRVEEWLSNQGDLPDADEVYFAMRKRELLSADHEMTIWRWVWNWMFLFFAGAGTKVSRLLAIHLVVFTISWLCVFSNPYSVEHPGTYIVPKASDQAVWSDENGRPKGQVWQDWKGGPTAFLTMPKTLLHGDWNHSDGFWVALNVQIPLIHIWARDEWEPASRDGVIGCWFGVVPIGIQYDTIAGLIQAFSYLTIPMMLASATRKLKRRGAD